MSITLVSGPPTPGQESSPSTSQEAPNTAVTAVRKIWTKQRVLIVILTVVMIDVILGEAVSEWRQEGTNPLWAFGKSYVWTIAVMMAITVVGMFVLGIPAVAAVTVFGRVAGFAILVATALWIWAGSYNWWRDVLIALFASLLAIVYANTDLIPIRRWSRKAVERLESRFGRSNAESDDTSRITVADVFGPFLNTIASPDWKAAYGGLVWLLATWILVSFADATFGPTWLTADKPSAVTPQRFAEMSADRRDGSTATPDRPPRRLGLALSGGGFRAAVMHAGVLSALDELGVPIAGLATVSGGSIIGGYYASGGRPVDFKDAVAEGRFNLKRELVDIQNFVFIPCPAHVAILNVNLLWFCDHSRIDAQSALLDRVLYGDKRLHHLARRPGNGEWWTQASFWLIGATDLLTGENIGISARGILRRAQASPIAGPHRDQLVRVPSEPVFEDETSDPDFANRRIAELVALSGAFPGAFASTPLQLGSRRKLQLVDGGITDNLGYSLLASAHDLSKRPGQPHSDWKLDRIIVSDGGLPLSDRTNIPDYWGDGDFVRAMDVVYASAGIGVGKSDVDTIWLFPRSIRTAQIAEADFIRLPETLRASRRLTQVDDFRRDFDLTRETFMLTSTLKDNFKPGYVDTVRQYLGNAPVTVGSEAVDRLFTLGQYLVYLNACVINQALDRSTPGC